MKNIIKILFVVIIAVLIISYIQPETYEVKRDITVNAPVDKVYDLIGDLKLWPKWSPWFERDQDMKITYSEDTTEIGDFAEWQSDSEGHGRQTITDKEENRSFKLDLEFYKPFKGEAKTQFFLDNISTNETRLTWVMYGRNESIIEKFFYLVMNLERMIGKDYEKALNNIKSLVE